MATLEGIGDLSLQVVYSPGSDPDARKFYEELVRNDSHDTVSLSEREQQVLDLYDSLKELELECSLLEAQKTVQPGDLRSRVDTAVHQLTPPAVSVDEVSESAELDDQVRRAENELLKAKATYSLRNQIIENVLMTDPNLKAVHSGPEATHTER